MFGRVTGRGDRCNHVSGVIAAAWVGQPVGCVLLARTAFEVGPPSRVARPDKGVAFNSLVHPMTTPFEDSGRATQAQSAGASTHATYPLVTTLDWPTCQNSGPRVLDNLSSVMM